MYCTDFVCTYHKIDDIDLQEDMYRCQFLQAFQINEWDDNIINNKIERLYKKLKNKKEFDVIFEKLKNSKDNALLIFMMGDDNLTLFKLLFKFELFFITHSMLCSYLNDKILSLSALENSIN